MKTFFNLPRKSSSGLPSERHSPLQRTPYQQEKLFQIFWDQRIQSSQREVAQSCSCEICGTKMVGS